MKPVLIFISHHVRLGRLLLSHEQGQGICDYIYLCFTTSSFSILGRMLSIKYVLPNNRHFFAVSSIRSKLPKSGILVGVWHVAKPHNSHPNGAVGQHVSSRSSDRQIRTAGRWAVSNTEQTTVLPHRAEQHSATRGGELIPLIIRHFFVLAGGDHLHFLKKIDFMLPHIFASV